MSDEYGYGGFGGGQSANVSFGNGPAAGNSSAPAPVKDISTAEFMTEVVEASQSQPVLVDFWAPWCGPCKQLAPALESAVAATNGKVKLVKMDIDKNPEIPGQMGVQSIPAVFAFVGGRPVDAFMGAKPESEIRGFIEKLVGPDDQTSQIDALIEQAETLANEGAVGEAGNLYAQILSAVPDNLQAISGLGKLYLSQENYEAVKGILGDLNEVQLGSAEIQSLKSALELAEQAADLGDVSELEARISSNPKDFEARYDYALALNSANKRDDAADQLLEIISANPAWNEEAAKQQLLQFFEAWGVMDEATVSARRRLSSLLFS